MSLLYKALNQASQLREKGGGRSDIPVTEPAAPPMSPLAGRVMAQSMSGGTSARGGRVSRMVLVSLLGITGIGAAALLLMPRDELAVPYAASPQAAQTIEPVVEAAVEPAAPAEPTMQQAAQDIHAGLGLPETQTNAVAPEQAPEPQSQPAQRIGAGDAPYEQAVGGAPKRVSDAGVEKFVDAQLAQDETAGLGPPVDLTMHAEPGIESPARQKIDITDDTDRLRLNYENAARLLDGGQPAQAQLIYAGILRSDPHDRLALLGRAAAFQKMQRTGEAVAAYEAVLAAYPGDEWALSNLLALLSNQNSTQALAQLQRLIRLNPENALVPAQVGMIHLARGEYEPAARHLEQAVALQPKNAKYLFNLAVVYDRWGQTEAAMRYYAQCLDLAARNKDSQIPVEIVRQRMAFLTVQ